jgi:hypothetical protein
MDPRIELLPGIPGDLEDVSLIGDRAWIGVGGPPGARQLDFGGHRLRTTIPCRFPLVCALDPETAALADARTVPGRPNAWIIGADGKQLAEFHVGDAVQSVAAIDGRLVVTHFDEGYGNPLHGMLAFDRAGNLELDYADLSGAVDIVDCYAVGAVGGHSVLLLIYPDFPLAEVDLEARSQRIWETPRAVHGAGAVAAEGQTAFFHGPYDDRTAAYAWTLGGSSAERVGSFTGRLKGLRGGWFLGRVGDQFARVRFTTPSH